MAAALQQSLLDRGAAAYIARAGPVKTSGLNKKETAMTPAAFTQNEIVRDSFVSPRREEGAFRIARNPRRSLIAFGSDAQTPLFHAWRP